MEGKFACIVAVLFIAITHVSASNVSIAVPGGLVGTVLLRCSCSPLLNITGRISLKVTKSSSNGSRLIYNSRQEDFRPDLATFVGDLAKGDCSLLLPNNSRDSVIDFIFVNVNQPNVTLSVVEDPQPHDGASGTTVAAAAETSPTASLGHEGDCGGSGGSVGSGGGRGSRGCRHHPEMLSFVWDLPRLTQWRWASRRAR
ncbi:uncharacterized protein LOC144737746 [Lampetra planeri]